MANSYIEYEGNGINDTFLIPFGFLSSNHINATIDGVETSDFEVVGHSIIFDDAPSFESEIKVFRVTPRTTEVSFVDGASPTAEQRNRATLQNLYISQEIEEGTISGSQTIGNNSLTLSKLEEVSTGTILGRTSSGNGDVEELSIVEDLKPALDLGNSSGLDVGTTTGTVAAGDDSRITGAVQSAGAGLEKTGTTVAWKPNIEYSEKTDVVDYSSASWTTIMSDSITVPVSSSRVNIKAMLNIQEADGSTVRYGIAVFRGATNLANPSSPGSRIPAHIIQDRYESGRAQTSHIPIDIVDSPATTGAITYYIKIYVTSGTARLNRCQDSTDSSSYFRGVSSMKLTEIPT